MSNFHPKHNKQEIMSLFDLDFVTTYSTYFAHDLAEVSRNAFTPVDTPRFIEDPTPEQAKILAALGFKIASGVLQPIGAYSHVITSRYGEIYG